MSEPTPLLTPLRPAAVPARLWRGGAFADDPWRTIADGEPLPTGGHAIVSLARWRAGQAAIATLGIPVGVGVAAGETPDAMADGLLRLAVIALAFPKFSDGRAYSTARRLREAGHTGELRATGDVLLDQLPLLLRAGFDAFEIGDAATMRALEAGRLPAVSRIYQAGTPTAPGDWQRRSGVRRPPAGA